MAEVNDNKFSIEKNEGFFLYSEHSVNDIFNQYVNELTSMIESTSDLWEKNFAKGGSAEEGLRIYEQSGEPLLRTEKQVSLRLCSDIILRS